LILAGSLLRKTGCSPAPSISTILLSFLGKHLAQLMYYFFLRSISRLIDQSKTIVPAKNKIFEIIICTILLIFNKQITM